MKIENWIKKEKNLKIEKKNGKIIIVNNSDREEKIYARNIIKCNNEYINVQFIGKTIKGSGALLKMMNRSKICRMDVILNSESSSTENMKGYLLPIVIIKPNTIIEIDKVEIETSKKPLNTYNKYLGKNNILLITPLYPTPDNLYSCGFVHSRVKEYKKQNFNIDIVCVHNYNSMGYYEIEDVGVYKTDYSQLRSILMSKKYDAILVHFFDEKYAYYLETSYLNDTPVFFWNHGADILYWDYKQFYTPYFKNDYKISKETEHNYKERDKYINKFVNKENFYWIFVSESERKRAEEIHKINFRNSIVIPNIINKDIFKYKEKNIEDRKKIFILRRFDNTKKYAIDISVLTILELSRRSIFNELEFYICGEGNYHKELVEPIIKFKNVHIINNFLSHNQIKDIHNMCGIGLFPTRQDTQGVSALEAASSRISNNNIRHRCNT